MKGTIAQPPRNQDSFLYGPNMPFIEELFQAYRQNPQSVSQDWQQFFQSLGPIISEDDDHPPLGSKRLNTVSTHAAGQESALAHQLTQEMLDSLRALMMIRTHRVRGHL